MKNPLIASVVVPAAVFAFASISPVPVAAQAPSSGVKAVAPSRWTPPRTPDGQPDLQGVWNYSTLTPLERPNELGGKEVLTDEEAAEFERRRLEVTNPDRRDAAGLQFNGVPSNDIDRAYNAFWYDYGTKVIANRRTSLIVDPPSGRIPPLKPEAQQRAAARADSRRGRGPADSWEDRSLGERCILGSIPKFPSAYNNNYQIFQAPGYVAILQEMMHEARIIPLDGRPHLSQGVRQWLGDSRGRWEGNTLVVETTNFTDKTNFRGSTSSLKLVERFTRVNAETIDYQVSIEDPGTWTSPWTVAFPMTKSPDNVYEYACHEGNYGMFGILSGARAQERSGEDAKR
jgi:hypothetical protein